MIKVSNLDVNFETPSETVEVLKGLDFSVEEAAAASGGRSFWKWEDHFAQRSRGLAPAYQRFSRNRRPETLPDSKKKKPTASEIRELGFVFQQHHLLPQLTVMENVLTPRLAGGWEESEEETRRRATELLERVGLSHRVNHRPGQLSGGEKQRTAVARALINRPRVVLADEPTGALDSAIGNKIADLLLEIQRESGVTLVVVTHDRDLAQRVGGIFDLGN